MNFSKIFPFIQRTNENKMRKIDGIRLPNDGAYVEFREAISCNIKAMKFHADYAFSRSGTQIQMFESEIAYKIEF